GDVRSYAREDRRPPLAHVADGEQEHVRRRLRHRQTDAEMDQVAARDDAVQTDDADPCGDDVREDAHRPGPSGTTYSRRNSVNSTRLAAATSIPADQLTKTAVPPD